MLLERYSIQPHVLKRVHCKKGWAYAGTVTNLHFVLNTPKNSYLNQATQKNNWPKFSYPKNPKVKISNAKKLFDHPCHLKSGVPPPPQVM